jgi:amino acid adenylation domain-containing protein
MSPDPSSHVVEHDPFGGGEIERTAPTTEPQREVLAAAVMGPEGNLAYNEAIVLSIEGTLNRELVERALGELVARHDALRTTFAPDLDELRVTALRDFRLERRDLTDLEPAQQAADLDAAMLEAVTQPLSLVDGPLFRATWLQLGEQRAELILLAHHAICDGWSFHLLLQELQDLCCGVPVAALPPAPSFAAFAREQAQRGLRPADGEYWAVRFVDRPAAVDLPTDRPRPPHRTFTAARIDRRLSPEVTRAIQASASSARASQVHALVGGVASLLQRLTESEDIVIGMPFARQALEARPGLVGHAVQLLPIRVAVSPDARFVEVIECARAAVLDASDHYDVTFGALVRDLGYSGDAARVPLAPVMLNLDQPLAPLRLGDAVARVRSVPRRAEGFELFLNFAPVEGPDETSLVVEATYNTQLFDAETIHGWLNALERLFLVGASAPATPVSGLALMAPGATDGALFGPAVPARWDTWLQRLADLAQEHPTATAVIDGRGALTYGQLVARAEALAAELMRRGVRRGDIVGVCTSRSRELVISIAAVHLAGAAHLPLDAEHPAPRLTQVIADARCMFVLADGDLPPGLGAAALTSIDPRGNLPRPAGAFPNIAASDLAYLIYTSGSTGVPKGVRITHGALVNFLESVAQRPGCQATDVLLAVTTVSFDISLLELLLPLTTGARVVVARRDEAEDPRVLAHLIRRHAVTILQATPATWRMLIDSGWPGAQSLVAFAGGERLPPELAAALLPRVRALWNLYGPTETTIWSTAAEVRSASTASLLGAPLHNTTIHVLDRRGMELPRGVPGELCIGGAGLAEGYHDRSQLTVERFLDHVRLGRVYRTGDRGRIRWDGALECLGRIDQQVKVNGFRIELGDVEAAIATHPSVAEAAVTLEGEAGRAARLVAHVVGRAVALDVAALNDHTRALLPAYMVPRQWIGLKALPRLPNGKLDRRRLSVGVAPLATGEVFVEPHGALEIEIAARMASALGMEKLSAESDFFAAGGHSLLAAQLVAELNRGLDIELTMRDVFEAPTPRGLAALAAGGGRRRGERSRIVRREDRRVAPATHVQERMWFMHQALPGRPAYNLPSAHRLRGTLDVEIFERALRTVVQRQSILRTTFERRGKELVQLVHDACPIDLGTTVDLSALDEAERETRLLADLERRTDEPFDLARLPLFRAHLYRLGADEHVFFFMPHHIVWDGWSFDVLYTEFSAVYAALDAGKPSPLPQLAIEYGDFAAWQRARLETTTAQQHAATWRERLQRLGPFPALLGDQRRRPGISGVGATEWVTIDADRTQALHVLARERGATLFAASLALYALLLHERSGASRLLLAMPVRGREESELEPLMGCCNNLLPLLIEIEEADTFEDLLARTKLAILDTLASPDVLLERLVARGSGLESVLYQALFSLQDVRRRVLDWGGLQHTMIPLFQRGATEDLGLWFIEGEDGLTGGLTYNVEVFSAELVRHLRARLLELVDQVLGAPTARVDGLCDRGRWRRVAGSTADGVVSPARGERVEPSHEAMNGVDAREQSVLPSQLYDYALILTRIWQEILGLPKVGEHESFFDLGGNSLTAIDVVRRFEALTGHRLELGEFFQAPTIAEQATSIASGAQTRRMVIPLQPEGAATPLFCLLGIWIYRELAEALAPEQPTYGVYVHEEQCLVLGDDEEANAMLSIDRLAAAYCDAIREARPEGPYRLAGLSFGGVIAMEVARRLERAGAVVEHVVLLDSVLPPGYRRVGWRKAASNLKRLGTQALGAFSALVPISWMSPTNWSTRRATQHANRRLGEAREREVARWLTSFEPCAIPVTFVRATDRIAWGPGYVFDVDGGWGAYLGRPPCIHSVAGDHVGILRPPHVQSLGSTIRLTLGN